MAKKSKLDDSWPRLSRRDWVIAILAVVMVATNLYWLNTYRSLQDQINRGGIDSFNNTVQITNLKRCLEQGIQPCPTPQHFNYPW